MIRLEGATLLTPEHEISDGVLVLDGARIAYAGSRDGAPPAAPGDDVSRLPGRVIIPGFVNTHTHLAMQILRGVADDVALMPWLEEHVWPIEARMTPEDILQGTRLALLEAVAAGVTCVNDMYGSMDRVAEAIGESGIRGMITQGLIGAQDPERDSLRRGVALYERWQGAMDNRLQVALGPHAPYTCPPDYLREVADYATALHAPVHIHLAETRGETEELLRQGTTPAQVLTSSGLAREHVVAAHGVFPAEGDIARLASLDVGVAHCPISNLKLGCGFAPTRRLREAGVPVGIGSDGAASANVLDPFLSMKAAAWIAKGTSEDAAALTAKDVLRMATREGAMALGWQELGALEQGYLADVVVVDLRSYRVQPVFDPFSAIVYTATAQQVERVYASGRLVYSEGRHLVVDAAEVLSSARASAQRLAERPLL